MSSSHETTASSSGGAPSSSNARVTSAEQLVLQLANVHLRENALRELVSRPSQELHRLGPLLWNSSGAIPALLEEILGVYPFLWSPSVRTPDSIRVCNCLVLLKYVACHSELRMPFLMVRIPLYLYPILYTSSPATSFTYLRHSSLGVVAALVKVFDRNVIDILLRTEIIPLCLHNIEIGNMPSKELAAFIIWKILAVDVGLNHICAVGNLVYDVTHTLSMTIEPLLAQKMVGSPMELPATGLLKHIIVCYSWISFFPRGCDALRDFLPAVLRDGTFSSFVRDDQRTWEWLENMLLNIGKSGCTSQ